MGTQQCRYIKGYHGDHSWNCGINSRVPPPHFYNIYVDDRLLFIKVSVFLPIWAILPTCVQQYTMAAPLSNGKHDHFLVSWAHTNYNVVGHKDNIHDTFIKMPACSKASPLLWYFINSVTTTITPDLIRQYPQEAKTWHISTISASFEAESMVGLPKFNTVTILEVM